MMKRFAQVQLLNVANVISGYAFKSEDLTNDRTEVPVLKIANVTPPVATLVFEDHFPREKISDRIAKYFIRDRDVLVAMTGMGSVGRVSVVRGIRESVLLNQRVGVVRGKQSVYDQQFLGCVLTANHYEKTLYDLGIGAGQPNVSPKDIGNLLVPLPPLAVQKTIAAILSAYDELIESNKRRISLLEKMAEEIYREWFVRLRFPGHKKVTVIKGLPNGWERKGLSSLGTYLNGYAFEPSDWGLEGTPIIKIKEMTSGITADTPRNSGEHVPAKYHFDDGAVIFSWSATLLVVIWDQGPRLLNQHLFKVDPAPDVPKSFLYFSIKFSIPIFESLTTGATMQHIKRKELHFVKVNLPPVELRKQFDSVVSPILEQKLRLTQANQKLIESRSRLLPRLISGKLSVENLNIRFPPGMAEELKAEPPAAANA